MISGGNRLSLLLILFIRVGPSAVCTDKRIRIAAVKESPHARADGRAL